MYAIIRNNIPELVNRAFRDEAGISHPVNVLDLWTSDALATIGVYSVTDGPIPEGHIVTDSSLHWDADTSTVTRTFTTALAPPPSVPSSVTPLQMRKALRQLGMLATINAMVAGSDEVTRDEWEYAIQYDRAHPSWALMGALLNPPLTSADIDNVFYLAATL